MDRQKRILIIAGPNGAGKTTFATEFLPREAECPNFINADLIAACKGGGTQCAGRCHSSSLLFRIKEF